MLCLLGLTTFEENLITRQPIIQTLVKRRLPHFLGFSLLINAILFQSVSLYAIVISRDHSHAAQMQEAADFGQACQLGGAAALFLASI
jgi:hypothetical protein